MIERGSDKHGFRMDDGLKSETELLIRGNRDPRVEEWKSAEPSGEDQPDVDLVPDGTLSGGVPEGMDESDIEGRSELATYLGRLWPATREELVRVATDNEAPDRVLEQLRSLPMGRSFTNLQEVWSTLSGGHVESHRF